jgi:RimJ/RimL family protein N-acetyltransferase
MELVPYGDGDYWLTKALETDPLVMAELGGPWPQEDIAGIHQRRMHAIRDGTWWFTIVPEPGVRPVGHIGIFESEWQGRRISEAGWAVLPGHQGNGMQVPPCGSCSIVPRPTAVGVRSTPFQA